MGMIDEMIQRVKVELDTDPDGLGYEGKSDAEVAQLLNSNVVKQRVVEDILTSPINRILAGLGGAPNTVTEVEVAVAKQVLANEKAGRASVIETPGVTEGGSL